MAAVTASTNKVSPKMDLAGVDAGAKMFVGLNGGLGSATAIPVLHIQKASCDIRTRQLRGPLNRNLISSVQPESLQGLCRGVLESSVAIIVRAAGWAATFPESTIRLAGSSRP